MFFQNILQLCLTSLWFHLFPVLSSFGSTFNILPKPWKTCFSLSILTFHILTHPLASQPSFAVLRPDPALVLPLPHSDSLRTSERWSLTAQSLQQTRSLICMENPASRSSYPRPAAGLVRDRIFWDPSCDSSKSALSMHELSFLQNLRNLAIFGLTRDQPSPQTHPFLWFMLCRAGGSKESKERQWKFLQSAFQVSVSAIKLLSYLGWN